MLVNEHRRNELVTVFAIAKESVTCALCDVYMQLPRIHQYGLDTVSYTPAGTLLRIYFTHL